MFNQRLETRVFVSLIIDIFLFYILNFRYLYSLVNACMPRIFFFFISSCSYFYNNHILLLLIVLLSALMLALALVLAPRGFVFV